MLDPEPHADAVAPAVGDTERADAPAAGVGGLFGIRAFRSIMVANVLSAIGFGSSRFVFVWLIGELTDWNPATAILGIVIGLPPLFLSAWAGSLADRLDPKRFGFWLFVVSTVLFGGTALLVSADVMTVPLAMVCGFITAIAPTMLMPLLQALVPAVVPVTRLMQAVAIQNLGMMVSVIGGTFFGGAVIQAFGIAAGFWLLSIASALGALVYVVAPLPHRMAGAHAERKGAIREGARVALGTEPLRSLMAITTVMGLAIVTVTLLLPEFARDVLDQDSLAASGLNAVMSIGMVTTSMLIATRWTPTRPGMVLTIFSCLFLGGGLLAIGSARTYALTAVFCFLWGLSGGVAMTLMRTMVQLNTPPELMGRVMGLSLLAQNGSFPIGALLLVGLVAATSVSAAMVIVGGICTACCWLIATRPHLRNH